jgi:hypothetical protein
LPGASLYQCAASVRVTCAITCRYPCEDFGAPKAYINYILFDLDIGPYDFGHNQLSTAAASAPERLTL